MAISAQSETTSLVVWFAEQIGCNPSKYKSSLDKALGQLSPESLLAALALAKELGLNPIGGDIYVPFDGKPSISFQGWTKLITARQDFDGMETSFSEKEVNIEGLPQQVPEYVEIKIWRKGVSHPTSIREYMVEAFQPKSQPWRKYPRRMLRHKGVIQCARLTFGLRAVGEEEFDDDGVISVIETPAATASQSKPQSQPQSVQSSAPAAKWRQYKTSDSLKSAVQKFVTAMQVNGIPESQAIETIRKTVHPAQAEDFTRLFKEAVSPQSAQETPEPNEFEQDIPVQVQPVQIPAQAQVPPQGAEPRVLQAETPDPSEFF